MTFVKGNTLGKGRPKGSPNKITIVREERRAIFDAEMSEMFLAKIKEARPEYLLDQFLGKTPDKIEHIVEQRDTNEEAMKAAAKAYADALRNAPD